MIRIEQFLFEENIDRNLSESLILEYPDLMFFSNADFFDFFEKRGVSLKRNVTNQENTESSQKNELLQRFKEFKTSTDYDYLKKYIAEQKKIQAAIQSGNIESSKNLLDSVTNQPIDPFFNFVVRKILTGSENGVLPSESLASLLDQLTKKTKDSQVIDTEPDAIRDSFGRVTSFDNYLRNKGSVRVDLLDERFGIQTFDYVVKREFNQLQDAVDAEENILKKAAEFETLFPGPDDFIAVDETGVISPEKQKELVENLKKLIIEDSNSIPALQSKIQTLEEDFKNVSDLVSFKEENIADLNRVIEELADQQSVIAQENVVKDQTIVALNELIDATLSELEDKVSQQLTNTTDAFDAIATQIETQAKKAEENANKQLAAFEKAVGGIADALKPKEPEPDPENPAGDILKQIFDIWDKIYLIKTSSYSVFLNILKSLKITPPPVVDYVYNPPSNSNPYGPGLEISQILKWTNEYKSQFKEVASSITDEKVAKDILKSSNDLLSKGNGIAEIKDIVFDAFKAWRENIGDIRGSGRSIFSKAVLELVPSYKFPGNNPDQRDDGTRDAGQNAIKSASDPELIMKIVKILDETNRISPRADWNSFGR